MNAAYWTIAIAAAAAGACAAIPSSWVIQTLSAFLPIHTGLEAVAIMLTAAIPVIAFIAKDRVAKVDAILAAGSLAVALIDIAHTVSFVGMPVIVTPASPEKAINFWLIARFIAAMTLLGAVYLNSAIGTGRVWLVPAALLSLGVVAVVGAIGFYHPNWFPRTYITGKGLTTVKIATEWTISAVLLVAAIGAWRRARTAPIERWEWIAAAAAIFAIGEMFLTANAQVNDVFNMLGHVFKVVGAVALLYAVAPRLLNTVTNNPTTQVIEALRARYIAVLVGLAVLAVVAHANLAFLNLTQETATIAINVASRQRILLQRLDSLSTRFVYSTDENIRARLASKIESTYDLFRGNYYATVDMALADGANPQIKTYIFGPNAHLDAQVKELGRAVSDLLSQPVANAAPSALLRSDSEVIDDALLETFNSVVAILRADVEHASNELTQRSLIIMTTTLATLLIVGFAVFRPIWRKVNEALKEIALSREQLSSIIDNALDAIIMINGEGRVIEFNPTAEHIFGYRRADALGADIADLVIPPEDRAAAHKGISRYASAQKGTMIGQRVITQAVRADGAKITVEMTVVDSTTENGITFTAFIRDVTESRKNDVIVRRLMRAIENVKASVVITNTRGAIEYVNPHFEALTGYSADEVMGANPNILKSGDTNPQEYKELWATIAAGDTWSGELRNIKKNGESYWEAATISPVLDERGAIVNYVAIKEDITARKQAAERIYHLAHYDSLTNLPNRVLIQERLEALLATRDLGNGRIGVIVVGLDHFKFVNQSVGRAIGDRLLVAVADKLRSAATKAVVIGRQTGDEFVVIWHELDETADLVALARELLDALSTPVAIDGHILPVACSAGVAWAPHHGGEASDLIRNAEAALFQAKSDGRGRVCQFSEVLTTTAAERVKVDAEIRLGIERDEFFLLYQPQVDGKTQEVCGFEALIRWRHPERGLVSPGLFIPIAEQTGVIKLLDEIVLRLACRDVKALQARGIKTPPIGVNISAIEFGHPDFITGVDRIMNEERGQTSWFEFEITEGALMNTSRDIVDTLQNLKDRGATLAIDDFGTGYSSLQYLQIFPVDRLKIDQHFVKGAESDAGKATLCDAIVRMSHALGLKAIAEGVETEAQHQLLVGLGCDDLQGYYFGKPMPVVEVEKILCASQGGWEI